MDRIKQWKEQLTRVVNVLKFVADHGRASLTITASEHCILRIGDQSKGPVSLDEMVVDMDTFEECKCNTSNLDGHQRPCLRREETHLSEQDILIRSFQMRRSESEGKQIQNDRLYAESPMFFYCDACGVPIAILPENFTCKPPSHCLQCIELDARGMLAACLAMPVESSSQLNSLAH
jgi:hypothetical protein